MTLDDSIQGFRLRVLREAQWRGNVSATCRRYDVSRTVFYRWRARLVRYGPDGLHPKRRTARPGRAPALSVADERRVIAEALAWPTRGPQWVSDRLAQQSLIVAPVTVWRALRRVGLNHRLARLAVLEDHSATTGLLTERTARRHRGRHVAAAQPGDLCSLDSFYIGKLKGGGKVWQLTGCDCASSFGWARIVVGEVTAAKMAAFLTEVVRPGYRAAGWRLKRVLTDNGKESRRASSRRVPPTRCGTRGRSRGTRGPTGSSNACRGRFCMSTGVSSSAGTTFGRRGPCTGRWTGFSSSTTRNGRIVATACVAGRPRRCFEGPLPLERARRPLPLGPARAVDTWMELSTPFRNWTS